MKVLHIWDQSGVACVLSKYLERYDITSDIFKRYGFDPYEILAFYGQPQQKSIFGANGFLRNAIKKCKEYDIIHVHDVYKIVPQIRKKFHKPIILHYHGSILRNTTQQKRLQAENDADTIMYSTVDLRQYIKGNKSKAEHFPNPVDTDHFCLQSKSNDVMHPITEKILYRDMPEYISRFGTYTDLKMDKDGNVLPMSLLALQCLAQNLTVVHCDSVCDMLPEDHKPETVIPRLIKTYESLLDIYSNA